MPALPLVSVIVIFRDARKYLGEAINSILGQTYRNWELILVDDGSADGSSEIAVSFAERDPGRIRYHDHPGHRNLGMSASRNFGIRKSTGPMIAMLDADDVWFPKKLDEQIAILMSHSEVRMVCGRSLLWSSWEKKPTIGEGDGVPYFHLKPGRTYAPPYLLVKALRRRIPPFSMSSVCFSRELFERSGGFEEGFRGMYEDQVFMAKVFLRETVYFAASVWDKYRIHSESCIALSERDNLSSVARQTYLMWLEKHLHDQGCMDVVIWRAVRWAQWDLRHPNVAKLFYSSRELPERGRRFLSKITGQTSREQQQIFS
jgi:glycosyltransferase involved in cell wall biosynthesis